MSIYDAYEEKHRESLERYIAAQEREAMLARVAELNEGNVPCDGKQYCDGHGRVEASGEDCAFCREVDHGIWLAAEPD